MLFCMLWILAVIGILALYYRRAYSWFSRYGVKHIKPAPPFGNMRQLYLPTEHFSYNLLKIYKAFPEERFIGVYELTRPIIMLRDLDLIKKVTVVDFEYFTDHRVFGEGANDEPISRNLFNLKGQEWKEMRSILSPAFTSSKIRIMVPFMVEVARKIVGSMKEAVENSKRSPIELDCKDYTSRYANDVIASCVFGIEVDSCTDIDNKFYRMGKALASFDFSQKLVLFYLGVFPTLAKFLKVNLISNDAREFFLRVITQTMNDRENNKIKRTDVIQLIMAARKKWSDIDLATQVAAFFFAGFETVSTTLSFLLHEIALHSGVQDKLTQEIKDTEAQTNGEVTYDAIKNMKYLDMVFSETLRLWPALLTTDRCCVKDYNLGKPNDAASKTYLVRKGDIIQIPILAIQRDPKYYADPEKFDPERFLKIKMNCNNSLSYIPFGIGARQCIGMKFAIFECKTLIYYLIRDLKISPSKKTAMPSRLARDPVNKRLEGGHWLKVEIRT